eukprot:CAMPEP_0194085546 /NCGR_PEP_ID=MMETSP0149-20130528/17867_1 /TAXON_ID=122233 /ORGANISM="Chaetoceros debilis, Strain MM31A-1" /LENGTH=172 /DNA_ID=CAMNT_0038768449 /DNA_START=184 /DNA_END=702 /DNA_ORIENTATION=+
MPATSSSLNMIPIDETQILAINSASTFLSTISADIDNISNDDFATVFAGGIAVMVGGVFSTIMVGVMLEQGDSYSSVVADSYAQGGDDEFWDNLSPEEAEKTRELLAKIRASKEAKERGGQDVSAEAEAEKAISTAFNNSSLGKERSAAPAPVVEKVESKKKVVSMFDDYDE